MISLLLGALIANAAGDKLMFTQCECDQKSSFQVFPSYGADAPSGFFVEDVVRDEEVTTCPGFQQGASFPIRQGVEMAMSFEDATLPVGPAVSTKLNSSLLFSEVLSEVENITETVRTSW